MKLLEVHAGVKSTTWMLRYGSPCTSSFGLLHVNELPFQLRLIFANDRLVSEVLEGLDVEW